ncbi:hypothetical protein DAI22_04g057200 [Oryza sativa Japonica Group]|nr:hypothetical protein DAI22_04g057200 [Oryza sativa Japonica Group]
MATTTGRHRHDRLSALPDGILVRVLSHLGSVDAASTAALSHRWRHIHAAVPVVDLVDPESDQISSAIVAKNSAAPIRTLRLVDLWPPHDALHQAVATATAAGLQEFDVKLRHGDCSNRKLCPFRRHPDASADFDDSMRGSFTATPPHIFRCDTLRRLRLTNFQLDVPEGGVSMPSLEILSLKRIMATTDEAVQQLVSGCPNLADLTLEQCPSVADLVVASPRLESFAMICCHNAAHVVLHTQRLRTLRYKDGLPAGENFLMIADCTNVLAMTIDICESLVGKSAPAVVPITKLITRCASLTFLHLHLRPAMAYHSGAFTRALRHHPHLRQLALKGLLKDDQTIRSVSTLLRNTPELDVLSLFPLRPQPAKPYYLGVDSDDDYDSEEEEEEDGGASDDNQGVRVPLSLWESNIECLHKLRKIKLHNYKGKPNERLLAKYLLSKATSLEQFFVTLPAKTTADRQLKLTNELKYWRANKRAIVSCTLL